MIKTMSTDELIHATAITALVLGRDNLNVRFLRVNYNQYTLPAVLEELLADLAEAVAEHGRYNVPLFVDGTWLAAMLRAEFNAPVEARTHVSPIGTLGQVQWLEAK